MKRDSDAGFSLLELVFVVAVVSAVLFFCADRYKRYILQKDITQVKSTVALIKDAAGVFYSKYRKSNGFIDFIGAECNTSGIYYCIKGSYTLLTGCAEFRNLRKKIPKNAIANVEDYGLGCEYLQIKQGSKEEEYNVKFTIALLGNNKQVLKENSEFFTNMLSATLFDGKWFLWNFIPNFVPGDDHGKDFYRYMLRKGFVNDGIVK